MKTKLALNTFLKGFLTLAAGWLLILSARADWQISWSDEFNGTTIDPSHWTFDTGTGPPFPGWGNNELEYYTSRPENAYVANGLLHIVARKESFNGSSYTSAKLKTLGLFSQTYGRFEFSAKLPAGHGYWPALWLLPRNPTYGGTWPNNVHSGLSFTLPAGDSVTNFHLYALEWTTNTIKWFVDGQLYETKTSWSSSGGTYPAPFDQPFYILMNLAIGGDFGGNPDGNTAFPGELQVDYVRVYSALPAVPPPAPVLKLRIPLAGTNSPFTVVPFNTQQFYRTRLP